MDIDLRDMRNIGGYNPQISYQSMAVSTVTIDIAVSEMGDPWPVDDKEHMIIRAGDRVIMYGIVTKRRSWGDGKAHYRSIEVSDYWYYLEHTPAVQDSPDWSKARYRPKGDLSRAYPNNPVVVRPSNQIRVAVTEGNNRVPIGAALRSIVTAGLARIPRPVMLDPYIYIGNDAEMVPWSTGLSNYGPLIRKFLSWRPRLTSRWSYSGGTPQLVIVDSSIY